MAGIKCSSDPHTKVCLNGGSRLRQSTAPDPKRTLRRGRQSVQRSAIIICMDHRACAVAFALLSLSINTAADTNDAGAGAQVFRQCMACHSTEPGVHMTGPSLAHVWGRKAGTAEGFQRYSDVLKDSGVTWNDRTLDKWLRNPEAFLPGNTMTFPGLANSQARHDVIAYLRAVSEVKAPAASGRPGGMMGGGRKPNLRSAPPEGQVRSIQHCGDTYTIKTVDGKVSKVWEFNLRFKTDSSPNGPAPGKPVVLGAGMQGDRASVIFASSAEISAAIKETCP